MYNNRIKETRKETPISLTKKASRQQVNQRKTMESKEREKRADLVIQLQGTLIVKAKEM